MRMRLRLPVAVALASERDEQSIHFVASLSAICLEHPISLRPALATAGQKKPQALARSIAI